jgi:glycosyltransferase involved in cell wall biosynthesis
VHKVVRASGASTILVNLPSGELGGSPVLVAGQRPCVGILHIGQPLNHLPFRLGRLRTMLSGPVLRQFDRVLCVAPGAEQAVESGWGLERGVVGRLPLRFPKTPLELPSRDAARRKLGIAPGDTAVVLVGRLSVKQKGHDVMLRAASRLRQRDETTRVVFVGAGPDEGLIADLVREHGLDDIVRMVGACRPATSAMLAADVLVIPSRFEGLPLVALEALALGVPGVAAAVDGLAAVWPEEWLVPSDDAAELASRIEAVLREPAAIRRGRIEQARAVTRSLTTDDPSAAVVSALCGVNPK